MADCKADLNNVGVAEALEDTNLMHKSAQLSGALPSDEFHSHRSGSCHFGTKDLHHIHSALDCVGRNKGEHSLERPSKLCVPV